MTQVERGTGPRVAVVGVGYWGKNLARNFAELGALGAIVDANQVTANAVADATGAAVRELDDVLADRDISGVVIATRAETHHAIATRALAAGKHVFVEKPLVLDLVEAETLIAQADTVGRTLMVGHLLRYHPIFRRMVDLVRSGELGELRYVYSDRMSLGKVRTEENVLWSFSPHDLSMVLALCGEEPTRVTAQGAAFIDARIEDIATMQLAFPSGVKADIRASWINVRKVQQIVAICERGTIIFEDSEPDWQKKLSVHPYAIETKDGVPTPVRGEVRYVDVARAEPLKEECRHFLDCIASGQHPLTDGQEGKAVLRVLQRASAAMAANAQVSDV